MVAGPRGNTPKSLPQSQMAARVGGLPFFGGNTRLRAGATPQNLRKSDLLSCQCVRSVCGPSREPLSGIGTRHANSNAWVRVVRTSFTRGSPSHRRARHTNRSPHRRRSERGERSTKPGSTEVSWCRSQKNSIRPVNEEGAGGDVIPVCRACPGRERVGRRRLKETSKVSCFRSYPSLFTLCSGDC